MKNTTIYFLIFFLALHLPYKLNAQTPCPGTPTVTYAGKTYNTVLIGSQCWLKENLNVGTMVISTQYQTNNGVIEKFCYDSDNNNCENYGGLYQWDEAMQYSISQGTQGICPTGWHLPKLSEWQTLATSVNNSSNALKEIGQGTAGGAGTNTSGFSALLAGLINKDLLTPSINMGTTGYFWSSTGNANSAYYMGLGYIDNVIWYTDSNVRNGMSVRCIKNTVTDVNDNLNNSSPTNFVLQQNYPNPYNPSTKISYSIPERANVSLKVFDLLGSEVAELVNGEIETGSYEINFDASSLPSGEYFYRLQAGDFVQTKKMILMK